MTSVKIVVAEFIHESNSFREELTNFKDFEDFYLLYGNDVIEQFRGAKTGMGGFIERVEKIGGEIIPLLSTFALPSGSIQKSVYDSFKETILNGLKENKDIDGVLLHLHGAAMVDGLPDTEGDLLKAV